MWYPPLGAQITFPVERKPLLVLINNGCFACRQLLPETNIKETELACARQIYLEYFLHGTPLLTPSPSPPDIKEEKQMIISKNTEVLEEGHFSIHVIVTT